MDPFAHLYPISHWVGADSPSKEGADAPRFLMPKGPVVAEFAEIYSSTAQFLHSENMSYYLQLNQ
jgi:hypothetical protein